MRPLTLRLEGFTSFRDEQRVDFTDLDLFALWGPTGSGKSSILDAITYALYGKVERVEGVSEPLSGLVTHGQPRMKVVLDFECDQKTFRILRSTSNTGTTKVRLDRLEGEDWMSYGEGGDSVREVNRIVPRLVGLDYDAFTRSVLLPQGKFAEFLVGDAKDRRKILTELLGLELFGRMAQRSNEIAREAKSIVDANTRLLEAEYAGIDADAIAAAAAEAKRMKAEAAVASDAETLLEQLEDEWVEQNDAADVLVDLKSEVGDRRSSYETQATTLDRLSRELATAAETAKSARDNLETLRAKNERVASERAGAESEHGTLEDLAGMRGNVESLRTLEVDLKRAEKNALEQEEIRVKAKKDLDGRDAAVATADKELASAQEEIELREAQHDKAHRADLVGALTQNLGAGDPCPVCERPLDHIPDSDASRLKEANDARVAAQERSRVMQDAASSARVAQARAAEALEAAARRCSECTAEAEHKRSQLEEVRSQFEDQLEGTTPEDQLREIGKRAEALRDLIAAEKAAAVEYASATDDAGAQQEVLSKIATKIATVRGSIEGTPLKPLLVQVKRAAGGVPKVTVPATLPESPDELARAVRRMAEQLQKVEAGLDEEVRTRRDQASALVQKAREALPPDMGVDAEGIKPMLAEVRTVCRSLGQKAALSTKEASTIAEKLTKRRELEAAVDQHRREQTVYAQLQRELKNDRIVQFLQAEALSVLAAAAGEHLKELSDGRYRLAFEDDRFFVIDAWNGDEHRSVRTLSGGETFLASLGLALALSEQVQLLAVTERSRLQSLFLDEGFGSLDAETLDVVVGAISRLGSDGRLVGVITHVPELADSMPVRIEVLKGPRGSTIKTADEIGALAGA